MKEFDFTSFIQNAIVQDYLERPWNRDLLMELEDYLRTYTPDLLSILAAEVALQSKKIGTNEALLEGVIKDVRDNLLGQKII